MRHKHQWVDGKCSCGALQCTAPLMIGSITWGGKRISKPGDRCSRKTTLPSGFCAIHEKIRLEVEIGERQA